MKKEKTVREIPRKNIHFSLLQNAPIHLAVEVNPRVI